MRTAQLRLIFYCYGQQIFFLNHWLIQDKIVLVSFYSVGDTRNTYLKKVRGLLLVIPFHLVIKKVNLDANLPKEFLALFARVVAFGAHDAFDAGVDEHLGACRARRHAAIECRFVHGDADSCRLNEGILLGMGRAQTMLGFMPVFVPNGLHLVSDIVAMREPPRRARVTGNKYLLVFHDHASEPSAAAGGPQANNTRDRDKILVPTGTFVWFFWHKKMIRKVSSV